VAPFGGEESAGVPGTETVLKDHVEENALDPAAFFALTRQ
jgi:hypothetical protein